MTPSTSNPITSLVWKRDGNLVAEWMNSEIKFNETYKGRTTLNTTTGELGITDVHRSDRGLYTVEINGHIYDIEWIVIVLEEVPEPEVLARPLACSFNSDNCNLTCYGNTTGAGTVTYSWREDGGEWKEGERDKTIVNNEELKSVKTFYCQMNNNVSVKESEPYPNPFFQGKPPTWVIVLAILLPMALLGIGCDRLKNRRSCRYNDRYSVSFVLICGHGETDAQCFLILPVLLLPAVRNSALAQTTLAYHMEVGATLVLWPPFSDPITDTLWKRDGDLVAEWLNNDFEFYSTFNGRTPLNTTTGELVVQNMTVADAGLYSGDQHARPESEL
ncbi:uncharacterized protein AKAME5_002510500 [Lates japonicus]|uniref:Ig-like domain-containing protein n=1 Tax=Lates japonicus TaxID=270547 RepID=A0AAD3NJR4_LATJO|nr:uncharacterized protein AKAME5_002510500 [Lates japonicus]